MIIELLRVAGAVHLIIIGANFVLPGRVNLGANLRRLDPFVRQVFVIHHAYIIAVLGLFAALCFLYPAELAGGTGLGRFVCGFMAIFWGARLWIQLFYYDREVKVRYPAEHWAFSFAVSSLAVVLTAAALGVSI